MTLPHFTATFHFHGALEDFLPVASRGTELTYSFRGQPGIKDAIEAQGIPHPEVDRIVVNGAPAEISRKLAAGDCVTVHPIDQVISRPGPLRFVLDVNLGKLTRSLRLLGFDALYRNDFEDDEVAAISAAEDRVALTRDRRLLFRRCIVHGYFVRADDPDRQVAEVSHRFGLESHLRPFYRCTACNGLIRSVEKKAILHLLEPKTKRFYETFYQCTDCERVYWKGSHFTGMLAKLRRAITGSEVGI